jgi:bifunctional DNA-binding transcriptional regulator/antitoxin component of YhaV-PrlF toxin-antitoxin module
MKLQQMNGRQFFVTLPNQIVRAKGWSKGDNINIEIDKKGDIVLKRESL